MPQVHTERWLRDPQRTDTEKIAFLIVEAALCQYFAGDTDGFLESYGVDGYADFNPFPLKYIGSVEEFIMVYGSQIDDLTENNLFDTLYSIAAGLPRVMAK